MAKQEDVLLALELFHKNRPTHAFEAMHTSEMGLFAVLRHLHHARRDGSKAISSKELSDALGVSSARMTVLLKKLAQKGLVCKEPSPSDARVVMISLSEQGEVFTAQMQQRMYDTAARVVDEFGMEELEKLMVQVKRIKTILTETRPIQWEDDNV